MKKSNTYIALLVGLLIFSACNPLKKMIELSEQQKISVVPSPLELHGDSVKFKITAEVPPKMLKKGFSYRVSTFYSMDESSMEVGQATFAFVDFPNSAQSASTLSDTYSFPYNESITNGDVEIIGTAINDTKGDNLSTEPLVIAAGIITTPLLVQPVYVSSYAHSGYNDQEELIDTNVDFFFDQGKSVLKRSETKSQKGKDFSAFIADKNVTRTVTIVGSHSPEGLENINKDLSENRALAIEKYYKSQMKKYDYKNMADSIRFIIKPLFQNWNKVKTALQNYDGLTDYQKSEYTVIINGRGSYSDKEKAMQKLSTYKKVLKEVYPLLRTAMTEVLTVKPKKTNAEIATIAKQLVANDTTVTDTLSNEELLFAATLTPSLEEKAGIYTLATKSGSWKAHNNLAATYLDLAAESGDQELVSKALTQLEIAENMNKTSEVMVNLAGAYSLQGDDNQAYDISVSALSSDMLNAEQIESVNGIKGTVEIKRGDYNSATSSLQAAKETRNTAFNKGLAQLLNKDNTNAEASIGNAIEIDSEFALAYYALAITAARSGDADKVASNLKSAVQKDSSLKEKALEDLEFRNYAMQVAEALN